MPSSPPPALPPSLEALRPRLEPIRREIHADHKGVVPLVGSGLSQGLPSWNEFLEELAARLSQDERRDFDAALAIRKPLVAAEILWRSTRVSNAAVQSRIEEVFARPRAPRPAVYGSLAALPCRRWLTTNWDPWLRESLNEHRTIERRESIACHVPEDSDALEQFLNPRSTFVLHVHGSAERPRTCVVTLAQYVEATHRESLRKTLGALFATSRALLIGHSGYDPDLRSVMDEWREVFARGGPLRHWMLTKSVDAVDRIELNLSGIDVIEYEDHKHLPDLLRWLAAKPDALEARAIDEHALLESYTQFVRTTWKPSVPFFQDGGTAQLRASVQLTVSNRDDGGPLSRKESPLAGLGRGVRLHELISGVEKRAPGMLGEPSRWALVAPPGAGKSTSLRQLAVQLAEESATATGGPIPIVAHLPEVARTKQHVLEYVAAQWGACRNDFTDEERLAALRAWSRERGRLWLLLDSLDEVADDAQTATYARLTSWSNELEQATFVVASRRTRFDVGRLGEQWRTAEIEELDVPRREALLGTWIEPHHKARLLEKLKPGSRLDELSRNPLILTVCAEEVRRGADLPETRIGLFEAAVRRLLKRGDEPSDRRVRESTDAFELLVGLALELQVSGLGAWTSDELSEALLRAIAADPDRATRLQAWNGSLDHFIDDVRTTSGIFAEYDGPGSKWRYQYRSLGEALAALALARLEPVKRLALLQSFVGPKKSKSDKEPDRAPWAEVVSMLASLLPPDERYAVLECLDPDDRDLIERTLPEIDPWEPREAIAFVASRPYFDGDLLHVMMSCWQRKGPSNFELAKKLLWDGQTRINTTQRQQREALAHMLYALDRVDPITDDVMTAHLKRAGFAERGEALSLLDWVSIKSGTFERGSVGWPDSKPVRAVSMADFQLARTPVTNDHFGLFTRARVDDPQHPVTAVSWWDAWLFCRWIGARLPSESEWEYACRAGLQTDFSFGSDEEDLVRYAWFEKNSKGSTHPVRTKRANRWGLFDMHGNVWEWCLDHGFWDYESAPIDGSARTRTVSGDRVVRGGSWFHDADACRSAYRYWLPPSRRYGDVGFRPARHH